MVVRHVVRCEAVGGKNTLKLRAVGNPLPRPVLGGLLGEIVAPQEVHHVGKGRGRNIVEQTGDGLGRVAGEVPDDQPHAQAVFQPGVGPACGKQGKARVFAAAVHPHLPQPQQLRRPRQLREKGRHFPVI